MPKAKKSPSKNKKKPSATRTTKVSVPASVVYSRPLVDPIGAKHGQLQFGEDFLADVNPVGATFETNEWTVNPGLPQTFPRFSQIARMFDQYRLVEVVFIYIPKCDYQTSGTILMGMEPNPLHTAPSSETVFMSYQGTVSGVPYKPLSFRVDPSVFHGAGERFYIRTTAEADNGSTTGGRFIFATTGIAPGLVGNIRVKYRFKLYAPQLLDSNNIGVPSGAKILRESTSSSPDITVGTSYIPDLNIKKANYIKDMIYNTTTKKYVASAARKILMDHTIPLAASASGFPANGFVHTVLNGAIVPDTTEYFGVTNGATNTTRVSPKTRAVVDVYPGDEIWPQVQNTSSSNFYVDGAIGSATGIVENIDALFDSYTPPDALMAFHPSNRAHADILRLYEKKNGISSPRHLSWGKALAFHKEIGRASCRERV